MWTWGDRADWDLIDLEGWSFDDVYPFFKKSENYTGHASSDRRALKRGHDGPVTLTNFPPNEVRLIGLWVGVHAWNKKNRSVKGELDISVRFSTAYTQATKAAVQTAADVFDIPAEVDNNGGVHESASIVQRNFRGATIDAGMRMGTFMAYLRPAMAKQAEVWDGARGLGERDPREPREAPPLDSRPANHALILFMHRTRWRSPRARRCSRSSSRRTQRAIRAAPPLAPSSSLASGPWGSAI